MDRDKIIETITQKKRYLIDYANLKGGIFFNQKSLFKSKKEIEFFLKDPSKGLPILIPSKLPYFNYKIDQKSYSINENFLYKKIFRIKKTSKSYKPLKIISSFGYLYSAQILDISGKKNKDLYEHIKKFNKLSKLQISRIIKKHKKVCAFQTRNIPHSGHELLIKNLLEKFDHVIINPVIGPKKSGDVKFSALRKAFHFLIKNKYGKKRLSFIPILANMFYAGPYEAIHHANIRSFFGIKYFLIGRDHAGAQNVYKSDAAIKLVNKHKKSLKLKPVTLNGSYFCIECNKIIIKGNCNHKNLENISGTDFRNHLKKKKHFKYADYDMQIDLKKLTDIFVK